MAYLLGLSMMKGAGAKIGPPAKGKKR
jgi:hypothetical protein